VSPEATAVEPAAPAPGPAVDVVEPAPAAAAVEEPFAPCQAPPAAKPAAAAAPARPAKPKAAPDATRKADLRRNVSVQSPGEPDYGI
jgi:hypothetical protein